MLEAGDSNLLSLAEPQSYVTEVGAGAISVMLPLGLWMKPTGDAPMSERIRCCLWADKKAFMRRIRDDSYCSGDWTVYSNAAFPVCGCDAFHASVAGGRGLDGSFGTKMRA